ncbi:MAG: uroporphyrinogen decarboxylase family protein [Limnochordia bacterium]|nr:uroporphyrinogen decarboxylase family protein [Limnochordia bacterium]
MQPRERAATALTLGIPDQVPTFELEFQLEEEMFGQRFLRQEDLKGLTFLDQERRVKANAEYMIEVYSALEYSIIPIHYLSEEWIRVTAQHIRSLIGDTYMLTAKGDGTFAIPKGSEFEQFVYRIADDPESVEEEADRMADAAIERNKRYIDAGIDSIIMCSDYCFNTGPFLSPTMFARFVQPYLARLIAETKKAGAFTIKHTDGNIMPILDQLVACEPHALHSLDPMAGVDIKEVKRLVGDRVCLCGNVHCAALQTGTDEEVIASATYALEHGKPGGGYIFCTSNIPFKGMDPKRYELVLDVWRKHRDY